jgi:exopolysaccharide production protein ExoZ
MIGNLQILRLFAASGVVLYHTTFNFWGIHTEFFGVALFFVLSGYLMCKVNNRKGLEFATERFWRIVPNYWLAMVALLTFFKTWKRWPIEHTIQSFLFIPHDSIVGMHPVLGVGWTLNMEVYFYLIFTLAILIHQRFAPIIASVAIITILSFCLI